MRIGNQTRKAVRICILSHEDSGLSPAQQRNDYTNCSKNEVPILRMLLELQANQEMRVAGEYRNTCLLLSKHVQMVVFSDASI